ncbi:MAG: hypothetical protein WAU70_12735 [Flavobacteriales bacterium]
MLERTLLRTGTDGIAFVPVVETTHHENHEEVRENVFIPPQREASKEVRSKSRQARRENVRIPHEREEGRTQKEDGREEGRTQKEDGREEGGTEEESHAA